MSDTTAYLPLELAGYCIRDYDDGDIDGLCRLGSSEHVWRHLGDGFPHPYTRADAEAWLDKIATQDPVTHFAIAGPDGFCGGIGVLLHDDPCLAHDAEIGFWLGRPYWNRGLGTAAVRAFTAWARAAYRLHRLSARVFATNLASARVLRKCGYQHEGTLRLAARKEDRYLDVLLFGHLPQDGLTERV
jgi:[ribosomal protein S5]-alanine N-acetyltransferase